MPSWTSTNPVAIGRATKVEHYDAVFDNTQILRSGGIALTGQTPEDVILASSATQFKRLAMGSALQVLRVNQAGSAIEFGTVTTFLPGDPVRIAMGL
jgi:hypothetical protein